MMVAGEWRPNITCPYCRFRHPAELDCQEAEAVAAEGRAMLEALDASCLEETPADRLRARVAEANADYAATQRGTVSLELGQIYANQLYRAKLDAMLAYILETCK